MNKTALLQTNCMSGSLFRRPPAWTRPHSDADLPVWRGTLPDLSRISQPCLISGAEQRRVRWPLYWLASLRRRNISLLDACTAGGGR